MGADLALWPNAHRERQLAELLTEHVCTTTGVARDLGISANDVEHIVARLRKNGLPVATIDVGDEEPLYRVLYPAGSLSEAELGRLTTRSQRLKDPAGLRPARSVALPDNSSAAFATLATRTPPSCSRPACTRSRLRASWSRLDRHHPGHVQPRDAGHAGRSGGEDRRGTEESTGRIGSRPAAGRPGRREYATAHACTEVVC